MLTCINLPSRASQERIEPQSPTGCAVASFIADIVRPIAWPLANDKASQGLAAIGPVTRKTQLTNPKPRYGRFIQKNVRTNPPCDSRPPRPWFTVSPHPPKRRAVNRSEETVDENDLSSRIVGVCPKNRRARLGLRGHRRQSDQGCTRLLPAGTARDARPAGATGAPGRETPAHAVRRIDAVADKRANVAWPSRAAVGNQASVALTACPPL